MKLNYYLANRLREVLTEGTWVVGTNFKKELTGITWKQAITQIDDFNTVANLTFHIHYYLEGIMRVLQGEPLDISDKYSNDAPPITSEKEWMQLYNLFCNDSEKIIENVMLLSEERIKGNFADGKYGTIQRNIDAMIEHAYYHLGQIILIKKRLKHNN